MIRTRIRSTEDLETIKSLNDELFPADPLRDLLELSTWWVVDARADDADAWSPAGFAGVQMIGTKTAFLSRAGVCKHARGMGLQRRLIRVRNNWARSRGAERVWTYTYWSNTASQKSLIREGFTPYFAQFTEPRGRFIYLQKHLTPKVVGATLRA